MTSQTVSSDELIDPGVVVLAALLRLRGLSISLAEIRRRCGRATIAVSDMLRCSRAFGLKARECTSSWRLLSRTALPGIAVLRTGGFLLLGEIAEDRVVVADPVTREGKWLSQAEFEAIWTGRLVLVDRCNLWRRVILSLAWVTVLSEVINPTNLNLRLTAAARLIRHLAGCAWRSAYQLVLLNDHNANDAKEFGCPVTGEIETDQSALIALEILLRYHGAAADAEQIRHQLGAARVSSAELVRFAKQMGFKAHSLSTYWDRLARTPLPAIAMLRDGGSLIVGRATPEKVLVQHPTTIPNSASDTA